MKQLIGNYGAYAFNPVLKTITIVGIHEDLKLENILGICNVTENIMIYMPNTPSKGAVIVDNIITLDYDTSSMNPIDNLQIMIDVPSQDTELLKVLFHIDKKLEALGHIDPASASVKVSVSNSGGLPVTGTLTAVTTVGTITNPVAVSNMSTMNGLDTRFFMQDMSIEAFTTAIRSKYIFS